MATHCCPELPHSVSGSLTCQHPACAVFAADVAQFGIILHEEVEVLPGHIHVQIGSLGSVLLKGGATT